MAGGGLSGGAAAFWATRALEVVKRNDSPGLLWKRIKLTTTRKNNAKKRLKRLWQVTSGPSNPLLIYPLLSIGCYLLYPARV
uniref:Uncharacterized protein n=1 Tax=Aegilops tauschii subsp. strangulata TaxID=200361 RepID=A0A453P0P5_AEGTS